MNEKQLQQQISLLKLKIIEKEFSDVNDYLDTELLS